MTEHVTADNLTDFLSLYIITSYLVYELYIAALKLHDKNVTLTRRNQYKEIQLV